jgi:hypothetical protein
LGYSLYYGYYREAYFMNPSQGKIWIQDITNKFDKQIREKAKNTLKDDVFANEELPPKIAPLLVDLV